MTTAAVPARRTGGMALVALGIVGLTFLIYWPAIHGAWLWDDGLEIAANLSLRVPSGWWTQWTQPPGMDYFPLKGSLQWLEWTLWGDSPTGFHAVNIGLHAMAALLLWRVLAQLGLRFGWVGALVLAVHPLAVESVAWISEQKNEWSLVFMLLAALAFLGFEKSGRWGTYAAALAWFTLAMLCKSTVAMFPVLVLLYSFWKRGRIGGRDVGRSAPFFLVALGLGLVTLWFQTHRAIGIHGAMPPFGVRAGQAGWSALLYLKALVLPMVLMPIYAPVSLPGLAWVPWVVLAAAFGWLLRSSRPWARSVFFGLAVILVPLLPILGLVPLSYLRVAPRADHLGYLALLGFAGLLTAAVGAGVPPSKADPLRRRAAWSVISVVLVLFALGSRSLAVIYATPETFWTAAAERNPRAWVAQANLGQIRLDRGDATGAVGPLEQAALLQADSAEVHTTLGSAYDRLGRRSAARLQFEAALRVNPGFAGAQYDLGRLDLEEGEPIRAEALFRQALAADPGLTEAHNNLGLALAHQQRWAEAIAEYRAALALEPGMINARLNLGNALARTSHFDEALATYRAALAIEPANRAVRANLVATLRYLGREAEANAAQRGGASP